MRDTEFLYQKLARVLAAGEVPQSITLSPDEMRLLMSTLVAYDMHHGVKDAHLAEMRVVVAQTKQALTAQMQGHVKELSEASDTIASLLNQVSELSEANVMLAAENEELIRQTSKKRWWG